jgi:hypothetical protein
MIAFATPEELAQHRRDLHSRAMPRFNRARARPLPLGPEAFHTPYSLPMAPASSQNRRVLLAWVAKQAVRTIHPLVMSKAGQEQARIVLISYHVGVVGASNVRKTSM